MFVDMIKGIKKNVKLN